MSSAVKPAVPPICFFRSAASSSRSALIVKEAICYFVRHQDQWSDLERFICRAALVILSARQARSIVEVYPESSTENLLKSLFFLYHTSPTHNMRDGLFSEYSAWFHQIIPLLEALTLHQEKRGQQCNPVHFTSATLRVLHALSSLQEPLRVENWPTYVQHFYHPRPDLKAFLKSVRQEGEKIQNHIGGQEANAPNAEELLTYLERVCHLMSTGLFSDRPAAEQIERIAEDILQANWEMIPREELLTRWKNLFELPAWSVISPCEKSGEAEALQILLCRRAAKIFQLPLAESHNKWKAPCFSVGKEGLFLLLYVAFRKKGNTQVSEKIGEAQKAMQDLTYGQIHFKRELLECSVGSFFMSHLKEGEQMPAHAHAFLGFLRKQWKVKFHNFLAGREGNSSCLSFLHFALHSLWNRASTNQEFIPDDITEAGAQFVTSAMQDIVMSLPFSLTYEFLANRLNADLSADEGATSTSFVSKGFHPLSAIQTEFLAQFQREFLTFLRGYGGRGVLQGLSISADGLLP